MNLEILYFLTVHILHPVKRSCELDLGIQEEIKDDIQDEIQDDTQKDNQDDTQDDI